MDPLYEFTSQAGIRRDGTNLDTPFYSDGVWVRWQRARPRNAPTHRPRYKTLNDQNSLRCSWRRRRIDHEPRVNCAAAPSAQGVYRGPAC